MECAFRELEEETGYRVESPENLEYLMSLTTTVAFCDEAIDIFVAHNLIPSHQNLDEDEGDQCGSMQPGRAGGHDLHREDYGRQNNCGHHGLCKEIPF